MRTITVSKDSPYFSESELGPPKFMLADIVGGVVQIVTVTHPEEGKFAMAEEVQRIRQSRRARNRSNASRQAQTLD